jgi:hypothetical protein
MMDDVLLEVIEDEQKEAILQKMKSLNTSKTC